MLSRLRTAMREGGDDFVRRRVLEAVLADWLVLAKDLTVPARPEPTRKGLRLATFADGDEPPALSTLASRLDEATVAARLAAGHVCFAVLAGDQPLSAVWARSDALWLPFLRRLAPLAPGEVYLYDSYTHASFRRQGLTTLRRAASHQALRERGFRRALAYVMARNRGGLAATLRAGYAEAERHRWLHLGPLGLELAAGDGLGRPRPLRRGSDRELPPRDDRGAS